MDSTTDEERLMKPIENRFTYVFPDWKF